MITTPAIVGKMICGRTFLGDTVGGVAVRWQEREYVNVQKALTTVIKHINNFDIEAWASTQNIV